MQIQRGVLRHVSHRLVRYFCGEMHRKCQYNTRTRRGAKMDNNRNAPTSALIFSAPEGQYRNYRTRKGEWIEACPLFLAPCLQSAANTPRAGFELSTPVYSEIGSGAMTQGTQITVSWQEFCIQTTLNCPSKLTDPTFKQSRYDQQKTLQHTHFSTEE